MILGGTTYPDLTCLVLHTWGTPFKPKHHVNVNALNTLENGLSGSPALFVSLPSVVTLNTFPLAVFHSES